MPLYSNTSYYAVTNKLIEETDYLALELNEFCDFFFSEISPEQHDISISSRRGWIEYYLEKLFDSEQKKHLSFLINPPHSGSVYKILIYPNENVLVQNALEEFFAWSLLNFNKICTIIGDGCDDEFFELMKFGISSDEIIDGSEGDSIVFLYSYLSSVLKLVRKAHNNGLVVAGISWM